PPGGHVREPHFERRDVSTLDSSAPPTIPDERARIGIACVRCGHGGSPRADRSHRTVPWQGADGDGKVAAGEGGRGRMTFLIRCPNCGLRGAEEFAYGGESTTRPGPDGAAHELARYVYFRANVDGWQS